MFLLLIGNIQGEPQIWYEDNNMGKAGGLPVDFVDMFQNPEQWQSSRSLMSVYVLRHSSVRANPDIFTDEFIRDRMAAVLRKGSIPICIDLGRLAENSEDQSSTLLQGQISSLKRLANLNLDIKYIALQSALSKGKSRNDRALDYTKTLNLITTQVKALAEAFPGAQIGIIDALPTKGIEYEEVYRETAEAFSKAGSTLCFLMLDCPMEYPDKKINNMSWKKVVEIEKFVKTKMNCSFGMICTSKDGGSESASVFTRNVKSIPDAYRKAGGDPNMFVLMSWYKYPERSLPTDSDKYSFLSLLDVFASEVKKNYK